VIKVIRGETPGMPGDLAYHIHFECLPGRVFQIPEDALKAADSEE
jgi:nitrogen fixation protein NifZ